MSKILSWFFFVMSFSPVIFAQVTHKGISFQGVIKLPNGEYPTRSGLTVNVRILSPNNCILREEQFNGVNISRGYLNLTIGAGVVVNEDPELTLAQVMDNSAIIPGLTCLNSDGSPNGNTSFNPLITNGSRKLRISLYIDSIPVVADFNIRAVAYSINSETLAGKSKEDFIQTSNVITQARLEAFLSEILNGSGGAVKWNGSSFVTYDPNDGASLTNIPSSAISSLSYSKIADIPGTLSEIAGLTCLDDQILKKVSGSWQCSSDEVATAPACGVNQTLQWSSVSDAFTCIDATVAVGNINGTLPVAKGGTGLSTLPSNAVLVGNSGGTSLNSVAPGVNDTVLGVSEGVWASVPAGRTSCPAGYSLVGTPGDRSAFCISTNKETSTTQDNAYLGCASKTPTARLCSMADWISACVKMGDYGVNGMGVDDPADGDDIGNEWVAGGEFIDEWGEDSAWALGLVDGGFSCSRRDYGNISDTNPYRCCLD